MILPTLDLPAPFSPISACTLPPANSRSMLLRILAAPKLLSIPDKRTAGREVSLIGASPIIWRLSPVLLGGENRAEASPPPSGSSALPLALVVGMRIKPLLVDD